MKTLKEETHGVGSHEPADTVAEGSVQGSNGRYCHQQPKPPINKCAAALQALWTSVEADVVVLLVVAVATQTGVHAMHVCLFWNN